MNKKLRSTDPDIINSWPAMLRAAKAARALSIEKGTPFYVMEKGRIVDLNRNLNRKRREASAAAALPMKKKSPRKKPVAKKRSA